MLLRLRSRILSIPEISISQMFILPLCLSALRLHRCKLPRRDDRSIRRTTRARAPGHGHVGATVQRQESALVRASGLRHAVAPPHTRNCAGPAVRANILCREHGAEGETAAAFERCARVHERGAVDVRKDGQLETESREAGECRRRVREDRPLGERGCERVGCGCVLRLAAGERIGR